MKKILFIFIILFLTITPQKISAQTASPTPAVNNPSITIIGDSLTTDAGAGAKLKQNFSNIQINSEVGRPWSAGLVVLNNLRNTGQLKDIVVFALGTNQGVKQSEIDSLLTMVPDKKIVLMTIYRGDVNWDDQANNLIRSIATANPNIQIADWNILASQHPEWFGSDGTHPNSIGYGELARIIQEAIIRSGSGISPTGTPQNGTSNCVITKVGNPVGVTPVCTTGPGPEGNTEVEGPCGPLLTWAQTISGNLERGQATWYNRMMADITSGPECNYYKAYKRSGAGLTDPLALNWYWCTFIVIDSYNLSGLTGLDLTQADVRDLHIYMATTPKYQFVDYRFDKQGALAKIRPGYAFFVESCFMAYCAGGAHTGIIKTIEIDSRGNGTITTLESNNYNKSNTWTVAEWDILNPDYAHRPLVGFGGPI